MHFSDDGDVLALRFDNWKVVFMEQRVQGTLQFPPRQEAASFTIDQAVAKLEASLTSGH